MQYLGDSIHNIFYKIFGESNNSCIVEQDYTNTDSNDTQSNNDAKIKFGIKDNVNISPVKIDLDNKITLINEIEHNVELDKNCSEKLINNKVKDTILNVDSKFELPIKNEDNDIIINYTRIDIPSSKPVRYDISKISTEDLMHSIDTLDDIEFKAKYGIHGLG